MRLLTLSNITRNDSPIHYRRTFQAAARFDVPGNDTAEVSVEFVLESLPTGETSVTTRFVEHPPFPTVPALRLLKRHISELDRTGRLP